MTKSKGSKWSSEEQNTNKFEARNWKVTEWSGINRLRFGKHSSRRSKLFKVYRVLQMSGYSSPWFLFQTNHSRQAMFKKKPCMFILQWSTFLSFNMLEAPADLLVKIAKRKFSYRANKLSSRPKCTVIAVKRAMTTSIDHSTSALLMHVKRMALAN